MSSFRSPENLTLGMCESPHIKTAQGSYAIKNHLIKFTFYFSSFKSFCICNH